ncbi:MAG TPA: bifunctional [glutamate--ammonia ligase]-adenylyl-L-tyrosine phosphorylase/[glutamate--ammonia-ligase] adenylyltransferase [Mariprofundaceae bacterium]|nr:bifunctional [glutamate--ammonia ligase]-adenylyl-L-tyrosine phosphorylase/[glutamate--ammonia-ligase] adenylyltransferase [Mariprofundaceae bacterium]
MSDPLISRCINAAPQHEADIRRLFDISPWFAEVMRDANPDEIETLFSAKEPLPLPPIRWHHADEPPDINRDMRWLRHRKRLALRHILWWELGLGRDVMISATALSKLAEQLTDIALEMAIRQLEPRFGRIPDGRFCVIGLGKLGGTELNLGSDIDLLFVWQSETKQSDGRKPIDTAHYFQRLARMLIRLLDEITDRGRVWPVDMRLRPGGDAAPICLSFDATLQHYQNYGQTWERAMLIKARAVAGDAGLGESLIGEIAPFVYRRYLDYTTVHALTDMKRRIDIQAGERGIGEGFDVKRGLGGIREIEFYIQSLQLLHGGRNTALRPCGTLRAIAALQQAGVLEQEDAALLGDAYRFWRRIEHALQGRRGEQTHRLPQDYASYLAMALDNPDIDNAMRQQADLVHDYFRRQFPEQEDPRRRSWLEMPEEEWEELLQYRSRTERRRISLALQAFQELRHTGLLPERCNAAIDRLVDRAMQAWQGDANQVQAIEFLLKLLQQIAGRATWIDLLDSNPGVRKWLFDTLAASRYIAEHVAHDPSWLEWPLEPERGEARLEMIHAQLRDMRSDTEETEAYLADLGRFVDQSRLTAAMSIVADEANPLTIGDWLADTADLATRAVLDLCLRQFGLPDNFPLVCMALGKHGSREMGLVSDLDMVFVLVHDDPSAAGPRGKSIREWSQRLGRRIIQNLTTQPPFGAGYELDSRLRPSGQSGVLVTSLNAFREYQMQEAHSWEHQALCRARIAAGSSDAAGAVMQVVNQVLTQPRDASLLATDMRKMRRKMETHLASRDPGMINLKQDPGGLVDIEFLAQYSRLVWGGDRTGTVDTLRTLPDAAPAAWRSSATELADTYLDYRQMENALRVQLWSSVGSLPASDSDPEWETLRRHTSVRDVASLQTRMRRVRHLFNRLLPDTHGAADDEKETT